LIISFFVLALLGCNGERSSSKPQKNNNKKVITKKAERKKVATHVSNDDESLESDFNNDNENDVENELDNDFNDKNKDANDLDKDEKFNTNGRIKKISFEPDVIKADSDVKVFARIVPGPSNKETILYDYIVNGKNIINGTKSKVLKKGNFKKGDTIAVNVMIVKNDEVQEELKTDLIVVANTNPKIVKLPSINISGFKTYTYDVEVEDIDKDSITYELEGDIPPGMSINLYTGRITYNFTEKPESNKYVFKIIASDPDGGVDQKEITLGFKENKKKDK
jgi:hypothetical protein